MKVYVTGAGASKAAGYPLGSELLQDIDSYVRASGPCSTDFDYVKDWPRVCGWLKNNENFLIREAYRTGNLENIFSVLDFAEHLGMQSYEEYVTQIFKVRPDLAAADKARSISQDVSDSVADYADARRVLLLALEDYLKQKHYDDRTAADKESWDYLRLFANTKLREGDVVITFNYDSTLERVLYAQEKWFPSDGTGFQMFFQKAPYDEARVPFRHSPVTILHLHGAIGWYVKRDIKYPELLPPEGGSYPMEARTPGPLDTNIGLAPEFLSQLGVFAVDASLTTRPFTERQVFLHPSFFKNYEWEGGQNPVFVDLWRKAAEYLRQAEEIFIIGYSMPPADSAALTLLATNCYQKNVRVINRDSSVRNRLYQIVRPTAEVWNSFRSVRAEIGSFQEWLNEPQDSD